VAEEPSSPLDRMVDLLVYAPVGLAIAAKEELPRLVERGRRGVTSQVQLARFVGRLAVKHGTKEAGRFLERTVVRIATPTAPGAPADTTPASTAPRPERVAPSSNGNLGESADNGSARVAPEEEELAIPGYDSLSAPHVVQRLAGLGATELDAVRRYEEAHRGRRTILSRIAQLQADPA
jgi:hypothetical protein